MKNMKILIPIETCSRELMYKTYLSSLLAIEGFECYFGTKRNISILVNKFKNYIYLDKGYHKGISDKLYKKIHSRNGIIVNLDEEGAIDFPDGSTLKSRYSKELFNASEKILLWGSYQHDLLKDLNLPLYKTKVTGHPRFELLKEKYHTLYQEEVNAIKNEYGSFILINSNFGFGNNIKGDDFVIENYGSRIKRIKEIVTFDKVKKATYIHLVKQLAKDKNIKVIYRPHPEENQEVYKQDFKEFENVDVVFNGSVVPWIIASEVMIHPDCTTGIEAIMVGKKSISVLPEKFNPEIVTKLPIDISYQFDNVEKAIFFINEKKYKENKDFIKDFNIIDTFFSYTSDTSKDIVNELKAIKDKLPKVDNSKLSLKDNLIIKIKDYKLKTDTSEKSKLAKNKLSGFDYKNLNFLNNKLKEVNPTLDNVKIKVLSNQLFKFSR